ncbi:MAG: serine/threonine protein kinase, partial [Acidobacteria bacterium]|nr:serine/threonine protein kinase [Acidobacteriota bacterium]
MNPAQWQKVEELLRSAWQRPAAGREEWLSRQEEDGEVLEEVLSLLAADALESARVEQALGAGLALVEEGGATAGGTVFPNPPEGYRILARIGFGGTSAVYRAEDRQGRVVALKLLRPELADGFVGHRFEAERRTLERLESPRIARLLDAGTTSDGLPFVVTEYVDGLPLDAYCRERPLNTVLELFQEVCRGVHHAHRNLIIHRDLKAANILVEGSGQVKVLDFGLAAVVGDGPEGSVEPTVTAQRMLTPSCASPEQLRGDPLTTATDIYSLGVLLYQLCTGRHPQEAWRTSPGELARAILEEEPPAPSVALTASDRPPSQGPSRRIPKDLDAIVLKALAKEP